VKKKKGLLVVVSAPSGAGKSTLCQMLLKRQKNLMFSVSVTTRQPRPGEVDGRDYFFVSDAAFNAMRKRGELVEWAKVHGQNYYGTPKSFIERKRSEGKDILLDLDVQGALAVKRKYPDAVLIFIRTPQFADLERRLRNRSSESETEIRRRLRTARQELKLAPRYDYQVINDQIPKAMRQLETILNDAKN
jgi:guanylate kinase